MHGIPLPAAHRNLNPVFEHERKHLRVSLHLHRGVSVAVRNRYPSHLLRRVIFPDDAGMATVRLPEREVEDKSEEQNDEGENYGEWSKGRFHPIREFTYSR